MLSKEDDREIERAVHFLVAQVGLENRKPKPVILHSLRVGMHLYGLGYGKVPVQAAVLHDVLESTGATPEQLEFEFGPDVAQLVQANSNNEAIQDKTEQYQDTFRRCLDAGSDALAIKAADQMDNLAAFPQEDDQEKKRRHLEKAAYFLDLSAGALPGARVWSDLKKSYKAAKSAENASLSAPKAPREESESPEPARENAGAGIISRSLLLLRHGKAKPDSPQGDKARELNKRGKNDSVSMGRLLASVAERPDLVVTSDALRAVETAHLAAASAGYDDVIELRPEIYGADTETLFAVVQSLPDSARCVLMVGHNPGFEELAAALTGEDAGDIPLSTAAAAHVRFPPVRWADVEAGFGKLAGIYSPGEG